MNLKIAQIIYLKRINKILEKSKTENYIFKTEIIQLQYLEFTKKYIIYANN